MKHRCIAVAVATEPGRIVMAGMGEVALAIRAAGTGILASARSLVASEPVSGPGNSQGKYREFHRFGARRRIIGDKKEYAPGGRPGYARWASWRPPLS